MKMHLSENLIFETSVNGRRGVVYPAPDVPSKPAGKLFPPEFRRKEPCKFPEVSELDVVRHFTRLSQLNFSEDTNFYPLGSCTMKYNPKMNETAASLPGFNDIHPYQEDATTQGTLELLWNLEKMLCELTGMGAFSLHPSAGAQGEFAGLLIARAYFDSLGQKRTKVIVPDSAHGTNPASAALAGYSVMSIPSNARGRVDPETLKKALHDDVAIVMITCPNTLGLFEDDILEIAELVHKNGSLMYMDGANFNALVGLAQPAALGFDIMHLNLHKTFSVPHGGGGPGSGPVGVTKKLEKFLPVPRVEKYEGKFRLMTDPAGSIGRLRCFYGNTGALIRAYAYIVALGLAGMKAVSENSIMNANYIMSRLKKTFKPFVDEPCMHECVLSGSQYAKIGVKTLDIVKRLLDYGFYAPTIYFPLIVPEAIMIEPTETESKKNMDDFITAMESIIEETVKNPALVQTAPHTTPTKRLDEVTAARNPILKWTPSAGNDDKGAA